MTTKESLLTTAAKLFQQKGYSATGLNEIVTESGTPKGSLYHYFPQGKLQLAIEAVNFAGIGINDNVAHLLSLESDPVSAFQKVIEDIIMRFQDGSDFMGVSLSMISLEAPSEAESLRAVCETVFNSREELYASKLAASGYSAVEAKRLGSLMQILIEGAIVATRTRNDPSALREVSQSVSELLGKKTNERQNTEESR